MQTISYTHTVPYTDVQAKFKYDDRKPADHRERVSAHLQERHHRLDTAAADQQHLRPAAAPTGE